MSVPPNIMQMMQQRTPAAPGVGAGAAPGANPTGPTPPAAAPISQPQEKKGLKAAAMTNVHIAANMLEEALPAFGSETQEGQKILSALKVIGLLLAKRDNSDLVPAEVMQMVRGLPQAGGGSQVQKQILQSMQQAQQPRMQ